MCIRAIEITCTKTRSLIDSFVIPVALELMDVFDAAVIALARICLH